jgi:hypothetical protein
MLAAFTQHPPPSDFSQLSSIIPNTDSTGLSRSQDFAVDLTPLQNSIMQKLDPNRLLCRFESSGTGKCQDRHCKDHHWSDLEPSGELIHLTDPKGSQIRLNGFPPLPYPHSLAFQMMYSLNTFSNRSRALQFTITENSKK